MDFSNLWKHCYIFTHASFHTVYNYTWLTAISSVTVSLHCLLRCLCSTVTCRGPPSVISNQLRLHTKINQYSYNKNMAVAGGIQWCPYPHCKIWPPISCSVPLLLHISNIVFENVPPLVVFGAPSCEILATGLNVNKKIMLRTKKYECAYLI